MIYLIGGAPRIGKTTLARMMLDRKGIPFVPADVLTHALDRAYPELNIRSGGWTSIPEKFYPFLREFVKSSDSNSSDYVIEGDSFLPEHVERLSKEFKIKSVFLGTSNTTLDIIIGKAVHDDWVRDLPEEKQKGLPAWIISTSEMFKNEAKKYTVPYFDIAENREKALEEAFVYLTT